jgi:hypothetical protein
VHIFAVLDRGGHAGLLPRGPPVVLPAFRIEKEKGILIPSRLLSKKPLFSLRKFQLLQSQPLQRAVGDGDFVV